MFSRMVGEYGPRTNNWSVFLTENLILLPILCDQRRVKPFVNIVGQKSRRSET